ncbi:hypothetical protein [Streptomyces sp. NPDC059278]|uniref:hypothetical protein n=1 Tax=Streptomyces sp. NPDC059278 TaxID=3346801 RepID=UPI00369F2F6D
MSAPMTPEQQQTIADRDAQIIAWLLKKAGEYRGLPRSRQESAADAIARMADKISRGAVRGPETASPWERAVAGLNALVDADVIFHVEPDGHISAPFSDEHIEWDLKARRWVLTRDDEDEGMASHPAAPDEDMCVPGSCDACGDVPSAWCPDCGACRKGCHGGHDGSCTHPNAPWGGAS